MARMDTRKTYSRFGWKTLKERGPFETETVNGRIYFKKSQRCVMGSRRMDYLSQNKENWRASVNTTKDLKDSIKCGKLLH
jgi:hypothetical protein